MSSVNIYTSSKIAPYVYKGIHPITGEFYIGMRYANKCPSSDDLGTKYKTSSKTVTPRLHEFEWIILAEFLDKESAFDFEQQLIFENWGNPNMLNKSCHFEKRRFLSNTKGAHCSEKQKQLLSIKHSGKKADDLTKSKMSDAMKLKWKDPLYKETQSNSRIGVKRPDNSARLSEYNKTRILTNESREKMSVARKSRPYNPEAYAKASISMKATWARKKAAAAPSSS